MGPCFQCPPALSLLPQPRWWTYPKGSMSSADSIDIDHIARLARLALSDEEKARYASQLGDILAHFDKLNEVDVEGVEPSAHPFDVENAWHEDHAGPTLPPEALTRNAPAHRQNQVVVPKVVEDA